MERSLTLRSAAALTLCALAACASGNGNSSAGSSAAASAAATSAASVVAQNGAAASDGATVFQANCSSCHQPAGQGIAGTFPPLAGNPVVTGDPKVVIHIVKFGLTGKVAVAGHDYNGIMPAWGAQLKNDQIASVITYVRSAWGNKASAVSPADVAGVSK
jgi:mono/diheme cytochrome c family protein